MLKYIFIILLISTFTGCSAEQDVESKLLVSLSSTNLTNRYQACIFLSELSLSKNTLETIKNQPPISTCKHYLLAKKLNDKIAIKAFIKSFPMGENLDHIWSIHRESGYPIEFTPPYLGYLSKLAASSDLALDKLINILNQTKAADSENVTHSLAVLYNKQTPRIKKALSKNKTSTGLTTFIQETAKHLKGE